MMINAGDLIDWLNETEDETKESMKNSVRSDPFKDGALAAIQEIKEYVQKMENINQAAGITESKWIPCTERLPENGKLILLSFENPVLPTVGKYKTDEEGGAFYIGDDDYNCANYNLFVNAWMPLPEPYREEE